MSKEGAEIPKPSDFFLGIVNVLGILVPGAVLLFLNADWLLPAFRLSLDAHWTIIAAAA